jgi:hypothetical protein
MTNFNDNHNGIRLEQVNHPTIINCKIYDVGDAGGYGQNSAAIMMYDTNDATIENNEIYNCGSGIYIKGIHGGWSQSRTIVRKNLFYNMRYAGFIIAGSDNAKIYQNVVRDSTVGFDNWEINGANQNNQVVNNTFVDNQRGYKTRGGSFSGYGDAKIWNNIFHTHTSIVSDVSFGVPIAVSHEHNVYYNASTIFYSEAGSTRNFASWKSTTGYDAASPVTITSDPNFVNYGSNDFRLQTGSPARNLAVDIIDLNGNGSTTDNIAAGAYIVGDEKIGINSLSPVTNLRITN